VPGIVAIRIHRSIITLIANNIRVWLVTSVNVTLAYRTGHIRSPIRETIIRPVLHMGDSRKVTRTNRIEALDTSSVLNVT
jgi:hypothetical protein